MINYQRNNILFRITSSDAISKFKSLQAQSFLQLARKELNFNDGAREAVLLEFDLLSQWIFRVERICLSAQEGQMSDEMRIAFQNSLKEEILTIENVVNAHPEVFCSQISEFMKLIHSYTMDITYQLMDNCMQQPIDRAFSALVGIVSDYLEHILICFHELNNNYIQRGNNKFVGITNFSIRLNDGEMFVPMISRCTFYSKLGCGNTYIAKNYSEVDDIFNSAKESAELKGITLIEEIQDKPFQADSATLAAALA